MDYEQKLLDAQPGIKGKLDRLFHANNIKARDLMRGMEAVALEAGMPVYINVGHRDRYFSVFEGKFERGGINEFPPRFARGNFSILRIKKQKAIEKMQELFQEKYGVVYVQEEKVGFRVLVNSEIL